MQLQSIYRRHCPIRRVIELVPRLHACRPFTIPLRRLNSEACHRQVAFRHKLKFPGPAVQLLRRVAEFTMEWDETHPRQSVLSVRTRTVLSEFDHWPDPGPCSAAVLSYLFSIGRRRSSFWHRICSTVVKDLSRVSPESTVLTPAAPFSLGRTGLQQFG